MIDNVLELRAAVVDFLRAELIGPKNGETDPVFEPPFKRYTMGIIFPQDNKYAELEKEDIQDDGPGATDHSPDATGSDDTVYLANQNLPACVGMSFFVKRGDRFDLSINGARYEKETSDAANGKESEASTIVHWRRVAMDDVVHGIDPSDGTTLPSRQPVFGGHADLHLVFRPSGNGYIVTTTIINNRKMEERKIEAEDCLPSSSHQN